MNSHLDWIDTLPDEWQVKPLRAVADSMVSNVDKLVSDDESSVRLCNYTDVYHNEFITPDLDLMHATASAQELERFGVSVGDVLITKDSESWDDIGVPALVVETADDIVCGYHLALLRPRKNAIHGAFLFRCLQAQPVQVQLELAASGVTRFGLPKSGIRAASVPVPPLPQQRAIADYLDRETARLDALVAAKQHLLDLLAEKRRALITRAITEGIISTSLSAAPTPSSEKNEANMKKEQDTRVGPYADSDDGDKAARQSSRCRLKYLSTINDESLTEDTSSGFEIQYIDIGNVDSSGNMEEPAWYRFEDAPSRARRCVRDGDVIISTVRTYLQAIAQIHNAPDNLVVSTGFAVIRSVENEFDPNYCKYAVRESGFLAEVEKRSVGVSYPAINTADLADIPVPVYPLSQQRAIAGQLDQEIARLDAVMVKVREAIALLGERRAALIAAAVNGHIEVECPK